jgi:eukaryotic-like serine/threonine-protein kinase
VTSDGTLAGTAAYMSPEQAEARRVDLRSDIFSFGAILYEMVTGRRAFAGDSVASTLSAVLRDEPKPLHEIGEDIPRDLEKIINRCLRKDPARRFQHMSDLKVALEELREETESGTAAPAAAVRQERPKPQRRFTADALATLVFAGLAGGAAWVFASKQKGQPAAELKRLTFDSGMMCG